MNKVWKKK